MTLKRISKPTGPLEPDDEQGQTITTSTGWVVTGFRDGDGRYVERAVRGLNEQWYTLAN